MHIRSKFVRVPHSLVRELNPIELQVWCAIQLHAPTYTVTVYTLAKDLGKDRSYVSSVLRRLVARGLVTASPVPTHNNTLRYKVVQDQSKEK